jgi:hypothetical protein
MSGASIEVASKAKVNLKVTAVAGSGGGVTDHGALTGLLDDDHPQYQRTEAAWITTSQFTITDESVVITTGARIALPDAASHPSRTIGIGAAAQTVTIAPAGSDLMWDDPGNTYSLPAGNGITFVSLEISGAWGWAIYTRNGPAFDMPKWFGQSLTDGQVLKISGGVPAWGTASGGSGTVTSVSATAPISVANGTTTPAISIAAASTSAAGSMSSADKSKLDGIASGATANSSDATLLARANHTGTQVLSTISDAGTAASKNVPATGNAGATEVVLGADTRLTDTRTPTDGSVSTAKLADSAVTSAKIADGTIVNADISVSAAISTSKISGLTTVATDTIFDAAGDLAVGSGADTSARLAKGSRTQALVVGASTLEWDANHYNGGNFVSATVSNAIAETIPAGAGYGATTGGGTGVAHLHGIYLPKGVTITNITFVAGVTAAGTPTNQWFALCDSSRTVLRVTANDTTAAWAASAVKTLALTSTFTTTYSGLHYLACFVTATTVPSFRGANAGTFTGVATQSFTSTTGLTTPVAEGTTFAASTGRLTQALGIVS